MRTDIDLKPCPFCDGGIAFFDPKAELEHGFWVICGGPTGCRARAAFAPTPEEAAEKWNRRRAEPPPGWLPDGEWPKEDGTEVEKYSIERGLVVYRPPSEGCLSIGNPEWLARFGYRFQARESTPEPPKEGA